MNKRRAGRVLLLLSAAAILSVGFVHRSVHQRRYPRDASESRLEFEEAHDRLTGHRGRWQSHRHRRRARGEGWTGSDAGRVTIRHYTFGERGESTVSRLRPAQIRAILGRYNARIGYCLIRHGAAAVKIRLTILGTGKVSKVWTDLGGLAGSCVKKVVRSVRFPSFHGVKSTGSYQLRLR